MKVMIISTFSGKNPFFSVSTSYLGDFNKMLSNLELSMKKKLQKIIKIIKKISKKIIKKRKKIIKIFKKIIKIVPQNN